MIRFVILILLAAFPALANDRADSEAKLAALSDAVTVALAATMPQIEGMDCTPAQQDTSPTNRLIVPNWRADCRWVEGGQNRKSLVLLGLSQSGAGDIAKLVKEAENSAALGEGNPRNRLFGSPNPTAILQPHLLEAAPSAFLAAMATVPRGPDETMPPPGMDRIAEALADLDTSSLITMPEVQAHVTVLAAHRQLLEAHRTVLLAVLEAATGTKAGPPLLPGIDYPDLLFFGAEPLVQTDATEAGVAMTLTLTTSSFALEAAADEGRFTSASRNGDVSRNAVFNHRGRVQVYLSEKGLTALIDGRAMLMLDVQEVSEGADPVAAMETVLARIAANDFSGY